MSKWKQAKDLVSQRKHKYFSCFLPRTVVDRIGQKTLNGEVFIPYTLNPRRP